SGIRCGANVEQHRSGRALDDRATAAARGEAPLCVDARPGRGGARLDAGGQRPKARRMSPRLDVLRILIVDDHALFRRGLREVLEEEPDLRVVAEAADGMEALQRVRELRPGRLDLVLMDLDMPTMSGIAATREIVAE